VLSRVLAIIPNYKNIEKETSTSDVTLGNVYDMNKQFMEQEPQMSQDQLNEAEAGLRTWLFERIEQKYFMMLCHEQRDYTIFNLDGLRIGSTDKEKCITAAFDVIDCLRNRGAILSITLQEDGAYELWIRNEEGCFAYYLFPYGPAVLEY
jgi:hypothetical protein